MTDTHFAGGGQHPGHWTPRDRDLVRGWIDKLRDRERTKPRKLIKPIRQLRDLVYSDPVLHANVAAMFAEALMRRKKDPLGDREVQNFEEFLRLLNQIMWVAPEAYQCSGHDEPGLAACGLIGFPINALLDWPMATQAGYDVFSNALVNQQLKRILTRWSEFLVTPRSRYVLTEGDLDATPAVYPWLSEKVQAEMVAVARSAVGHGANPTADSFPAIFQSKPQEEYYGYTSWDDFFTRLFVDGQRPVTAPEDDDVIANACESAPYILQPGVKRSSRFWLKGQPYSLENMLAWDEHTDEFVGGTVYQAFLSALSYHRWHSPVSGTVRKAQVVNGSYYLGNRYQGFAGGSPDSAAPNNSQPFLSAVATRAIILIEADNPKIGLMAVIPIGMAEVSSCEITVKPGDRVCKGEQLGMFHFGGSTHCLVFRRGVELDFFDHYGLTPGPDQETNIRINTAIARVL